MPQSDKKIVAVVGATGNQGGSVAHRFLQAGFHVRALTRNPGSPAAQNIAAAGAELFKVDLDDTESLIQAFKGANVIFSVTDYWEPFRHVQDRKNAEEQGISIRKYAYNREYQQGKNITRAAADTVESLDVNGFLVSTLSHASKCSGGRLTEVYHLDAKADAFPIYVDEVYPKLAAKMSCIHTGYFHTSFQILPNLYFGKLPDGSVEMTFPTSPDVLIPHFDPPSDMGSFTYGVYQMTPGKAYMAAGSFSTWLQFLETWSKYSGFPAVYRQISREEMIAMAPDRELGIAVSGAFSYSSDPGSDGGMDLLTADDIRKAGIECPMTTWEAWASKQDWATLLSGPEFDSRRAKVV